MHVLPSQVNKNKNELTFLGFLFPPTARGRHMQVHRCVVCAQRSHAGQE